MSLLMRYQIGMKKVSQSGNEHVYLCPFPGCKDSSGHLYVNRIKGVYHCFKCGRSGKLKDLKDKVDILVDTTPDLREILDTLEHFTNSNYKSLALPNDYKVAHPKSRAAVYLHNRGVSQEKIERYEIGYTSTDGYRRVWFPDFDDKHNLVYYATRRYWRKDERSKYVLRWEFPKADVYGAWKSAQLYHYYLAKQFEEVVVVEGVTSAIAIGDNAVATYGTNFSEAQVAMLADMSCKVIYVMFDGDVLTEEQIRKGVKKGREKGRELARLLARSGKRVYRVDLPDNTDPADIGSEQVGMYLGGGELVLSDTDYSIFSI